jgi:hypothetical protein
MPPPSRHAPRSGVGPSTELLERGVMPPASRRDRRPRVGLLASGLPPPDSTLPAPPGGKVRQPSQGFPPGVAWVTSLRQHAPRPPPEGGAEQPSERFPPGVESSG